MYLQFNVNILHIATMSGFLLSDSKDISTVYIYLLAEDIRINFTMFSTCRTKFITLSRI
jgi:hypothetical protein